MRKLKHLFFTFCIVTLADTCAAQVSAAISSEASIPTPDTMKVDKKVNLACDIETGECGPEEQSGIEEINLQKANKVKLIYYTDPICSACWAIEPELRKFKMSYGDFVDIEYRMGGLLPGWDGFADKANGIGKPSDVAHHWDEVGEMSGMSIDGDVWINNPLDSSFPSSIAFKAMQKQGGAISLTYLRRIREMVFLENVNIAKEENLIQAAADVGADVDEFTEDLNDPITKLAFEQEMKEGREMGVRGFPTFIFIGNDGKGYKISGTSGYENYELALEKAYGKKVEAKTITYNELQLLEKYDFLASQEIAVALSQDLSTTESNLKKLGEKGLVKEVPQKYGSFWRFVKGCSY